jgi:uncharacterized protein YjlB
MVMEHFSLPPHDWVPNNRQYRVRLYRGLAVDGDNAAMFESLFTANGWPAAWRDGVFDYHHYHSTAHEVLGVYEGQATLTIGGPGGRRSDVHPGDALMLPAGTGHKCERASPDFAVVGAYPAGQDWDICTTPADKTVRGRIEKVPTPDRDPVTGAPFAP